LKEEDIFDPKFISEYTTKLSNILKKANIHPIVIA
jgi:hypothetical protein